MFVWRFWTTHLHSVLSLLSNSWLREGKPECVSFSIMEMSSCLKPASILNPTHTRHHSFSITSSLLCQQFRNFSSNIRKTQLSCGAYPVHAAQVMSRDIYFLSKKKMKPPRPSMSPLVVLLTVLCLSATATDVYFEDAVEDGAYMRREHCLTKPYHST